MARLKRPCLWASLAVAALTVTACGANDAAAVDTAVADASAADGTAVDHTAVDDAPVRSTQVAKTVTADTQVSDTQVSNTPVSSPPLSNVPASHPPLSNAPLNRAPVDDSSVQEYCAAAHAYDEWVDDLDLSPDAPDANFTASAERTRVLAAVAPSELTDDWNLMADYLDQRTPEPEPPDVTEAYGRIIAHARANGCLD